jgi:hypothetical protein
MRRRPSRRIALGALAALVVALGAAGTLHRRAGGKTTPALLADATPPPSWTASGGSVRGLLVHTLGPRTVVPGHPSSNGLRRVRLARCAHGSCEAAYNVDYTSSSHTIRRMLSDQRTVLAWTFADPRVRTVALTVWGPALDGATGDVDQEPLFTLVCTRAAVHRLDWPRTTPNRLRSACAFERYATTPPR